MPSLSRTLLLLGLVCTWPTSVFALIIVGYDQSDPTDRAAHQRFESGFPAAPVPNTDASFVAHGVDLSGVGWDPAYAQYGMPMISPQHVLTARHVTEIDSTSTIVFFGADGSTHTYAKLPEEATGVGETPGGSPDLGLVQLTTRPDPAHQVTAFPLLDKPLSNGSSVVAQGRGVISPATSPRLATTSIALHYEESVRNAFLTPKTEFGMEVGDSGGPDFVPWTAPNGQDYFTLLGNNVGVSASYNFHTWCTSQTAIDAIAPLLVDDGFAPWWVRDADYHWQGDEDSSFSNKKNWAENTGWSGSPPGSTDYAEFDSDTATSTAVNLDAGISPVRGLIFAPAAGGAFGLSNGSFQLGRGGIANWDTDDTQLFSLNFTLTDHQHWFSAGGGFSVTGTVDTGGKLIILSGSGDSTFSGAISGTGQFATDTAGTITLSVANTYSGPTHIHQGTLQATNVSGSATGTGAVTVARYGTLSGNGRISPTGSNDITVAGTLAPGNDVGTLTVDLDTGSLNMASSATLEMSLGTTSDLLAMSGGTVTLGGTLQLIEGAGFDATATYTLISGLSASPAGSFTSIEGIPGHAAQLFYESGSYKVSFEPTSYTTWQEFHFTPAEISAGDAAPDAAPALDGVSNLLKYALGVDPHSTDPTLLPTAAIAPVEVSSATDDYFTYTFTRDTRLTDIDVSAEVANEPDSPTWTTVVAYEAGTLTTSDGLVSEGPGDIRTVVARDLIPADDSDHRIMRLRVTLR